MKRKITHCPFCENKKTQYTYSTICPIYSCKCGAYTTVEPSKTEVQLYIRRWVKK